MASFPPSLFLFPLPPPTFRPSLPPTFPAPVLLLPPATCLPSPRRPPPFQLDSLAANPLSVGRRQSCGACLEFYPPVCMCVFFSSVRSFTALRLSSSCCVFRVLSPTNLTRVYLFPRSFGSAAFFSRYSVIRSYVDADRSQRRDSRETEQCTRPSARVFRTLTYRRSAQT